MKPARYSIDNVPMVVKVRQEVAQRENSARNFWNIHADYWAERGQLDRAEECRAEARNARAD